MKLQSAVVVAAVMMMCANFINAQTSGNICPNTTWLLSVNTNYYGGININATNVTDCQNKCAMNMTCTGVDWNQGNPPGQQCWMIGPWSYYRNFGTSYGIQHYDIVRNSNCPECLMTWTLLVNTNVNGGLLRSDATEVRNCQLFCVMTTSCTGIDWNPANPMGQQCWLILGNSLQRNVGLSPGVLHYDLWRVGGCPTVGNIISSKMGGYLTVDPMTAKIVLSPNQLDAVYFTAQQPCLALMNGASFYQQLENSLPSTAACLSLGVPDWPGWFARDRGCGLHFEQPAGQRFPDRFLQDTSFVGGAIDNNFWFLQSTVYDNTFLMADANGSKVQFDAWPSMPPMPGDPSQSMGTMQFALFPRPINAGPIIHVCPNIWSRVDSAGVAGGGFYVPASLMGNNSMVSGDSACRQMCVAYPFCVGVSYNFTGCFIMTSSGANQQLVHSETTTHWEITRTTFPGKCSTGCIYDWSQTTVGPAYSYMVNKTDAWTDFDCRASCIAVGSMCIGVNFSVDANGHPWCMLVMHYYYEWNSDMMYPMYFMKKTPAYSGCGSCSSSVGLHVNKTDMAAMPVASMTELSIADCLTACFNNPNCVGMEIRPNGTTPKSPMGAATYQSGLCYHSLMSNGRSLQLQGSPNGVTHFDVYQSPCGNGCVHRWQFFQNTYAALNTLMANVTSEAACRRSCVVSSSCVGISWNYFSNQCYLTTSFALARVGTAPGWNFFMLLRNQLCE